MPLGKSTTSTAWTPGDEGMTTERDLAEYRDAIDRFMHPEQPEALPSHSRPGFEPKTTSPQMRLSAMRAASGNPPGRESSHSAEDQVPTQIKSSKTRTTTTQRSA